jgi:hypothetical protein
MYEENIVGVQLSVSVNMQTWHAYEHKAQNHRKLMDMLPPSLALQSFQPHWELGFTQPPTETSNEYQKEKKIYISGEYSAAGT